MQPGQNSLFSIPTPPALPSPPLLEHLILEKPLPLAILLIVLALVCVRILSRSSRASSLAWIGAALLLAAGPALMVIAHLVATDREHMTAAITQLVEAVAKADTANMDRLLAPDCVLSSRYGFPGYPGGSKGMDKATILGQVPKTIHDNPISEHAIQECQPQSRGPGIGSTQILVRVVVEPQGAGFKLPVQSWWRVDWRRDADGQWRAIAIDALTDPAGANQLR